MWSPQENDDYFGEPQEDYRENQEIEMVERSILLIELENHLGQAAKTLRVAWLLCKHNGMGATAKELADMVLEVETAHRKVADEGDA